MVQYRVLNPALLRREVGLASDIVRELRPGAALPFCCVSARGCETLPFCCVSAGVRD